MSNSNGLMTRKQKESILEEKTYFDVPVHLSTGTILEMTDDIEKIYEGISDDGVDIIADYDEVITLTFNEKVRNRIAKYSQYVLGIRGVKNVADININDPEVKQLLQKRRQENKQVGGNATLSDQEKISAIQLVKQKHEPHYRSVVFEVIVWAMMRDDIFSAEISKTGKSLDCRLSVNLTDDLFNPADDDTDLDEIFMGGKVEPIKRDKSQAIEIGIAVCKYLLNENPNFAEKAGELAGAVFANMAFMMQEFDDEQIFRESVDAVLPRFMVEANSPVNGTLIRGGIRFNAKKTGRPEITEIKEETSESD